MKRLISFLVVFSLVLSVCAAVYAASSKPSITEQPVTATVKKNGDATFTVKAKNAGGASITWYFTNPSTGEVTTGKQLDTVISLTVEDFYRTRKTVEQLSYDDLDALIEKNETLKKVDSP